MMKNPDQGIDCNYKLTLLTLVIVIPLNELAVDGLDLKVNVKVSLENTSN